MAVPTIAVNMEPYALIRHGETGMLAHSAAQWQAALAALVEDATLRQRLGSAARADVLANHTTAARAPQFTQILEQMRCQ